MSGSIANLNRQSLDTVGCGRVPSTGRYFFSPLSPKRVERRLNLTAVDYAAGADLKGATGNDE